MREVQFSEFTFPVSFGCFSLGFNYGVALWAFWDTTTYTSIGYIVVNEKLNFLSKRV
jgi:hypothetical protein